MNYFKATLKNIKRNGIVHLVELSFEGEKLQMMALELPDGLRIDEYVTLGIKATHVALAKDFLIHSSFDNQLKASIVSIEVGELLCSVKVALSGVIVESIITLKAFERLNLHVGDPIVLLLPPSELSLL